MHKFTYQRKYTQLFKSDFLKLKQLRIEVESTGRKIKRLKSEDSFFVVVILDLKSKSDQWMQEEVHGNQMNRSNASKLFSKIENP